MNNKLTNRRTISARITDILVADSVPLSDAWKRLIDDAGEMELELQERRKPQKPIVTFYSEGIAAAANWVDQQRESYDKEHGHRDNDTGSFEFGNDAQRDYSDTLAEIAEGIRALHPSTRNGQQERGEPIAWMAIHHSENVTDEAIYSTRQALDAFLAQAGWFPALTEIKLLFSAPPAPVDIDRLQESAYKAGLTAGWNFGIEHNSGGFSKCMAAHEYAAPQLSGNTEQLNQAPVKQPASNEPVSDAYKLPPDEIECDICGFKSTDPDGAHYCCEDNSND